MSQEFTTTRVMRMTTSHWKTALHAASWGVAAIVTFSVATGRKQMDDTYSKEAIDRIEEKVDGLVKDVAAIKTERAVTGNILQNLNERQNRMEENWDTAFQQAGTSPRPSHRARRNP